MIKRYFIALFLVLVSFYSYSQKKETTGPSDGTLLLIGGNADDSLYLPMFKEIIGGGDQPVVVIPTARSDEALNTDDFFNKHKNRFKKFGFQDVTMLHTRNKKIANRDGFVKPLRRAKGVWIMGGRQWRLTDSYLNTLVHLELIGLLQRDGLIAGTSAGATIQGSFLVRGDTKKNTIMVGDHEKGLRFIRNIAVDQHLLARNRHFDMFEVLKEYPDLLGIGLDENTGILVRKDTFEVVGESYVAVYDETRWSAERDTIYQLEQDQEQFYFLKKGDKYNLKDREVIFGD